MKKKMLCEDSTLPYLISSFQFLPLCYIGWINMSQLQSVFRCFRFILLESHNAQLSSTFCSQKNKKYFVEDKLLLNSMDPSLSLCKNKNLT